MKDALLYFAVVLISFFVPDKATIAMFFVLGCYFVCKLIDLIRENQMLNDELDQIEAERMQMKSNEKE